MILNGEVLFYFMETFWVYESALLCFYFQQMEEHFSLDFGGFVFITE